MVPYFLSAGVHLRRDLAGARDELSNRHKDVEFLLGPPLGPHPLLDALVAARINELARGEQAPFVFASAEAREYYAPMPGNSPAQHVADRPLKS
jgi:sirohydrochlorin ferrochelatase